MRISLHDLHFHARHGVLPQERVTGGQFTVSLNLDVDNRAAAGALLHDKLEDTVDYAAVFRLVQNEMRQPADLLEHAAARIARSLVRRFPLIDRAEVSLTKLAPPIAGFNGGGATVSYALDRRLWVWDFDGTIADTAPGIVRTMSGTFRRMHLPPPSATEIRATIGLPLDESIARLAQTSDARLQEGVAIYRELFEEIGKGDVCAFPGVAEALRRQHETGHFVGVATSRGHESVEQLLTQLGLRPYVDAIVACEDTDGHKPDPAPVLTLCRLTGVRPALTGVIGDTTYDMEMGRRAGVAHCYGVVWGNHTPERLREAGADILVTEASQLFPE